MPLEDEGTVSGIENLEVEWPTGVDPKSQGDDHIRICKKAVKGSFPNMNGPNTIDAEVKVIGLDSSNGRVRNVGLPTDATDATRKQELDAVDSRVSALEAQSAQYLSFGTIDTAGGVVGGSGDFTCVKIATGQYEMTFTEVAASQYSQAINVTFLGIPPFSVARSVDVFPSATNKFAVYCYNSTTGAPTDAQFMFQRSAN